MTTRRLIASLTTSAAALGLAATLAVRTFPLEAQTPAPSGAPIEIVKGGEHLLHAALPEYPRRAIEQRVEGDVLLDLALDERGEVLDARVLSGPDELRKASLESALQWHYSPAAVRSTSVQATLRFHLPAAGASAEFEGRQYELKRAPEAGEVELEGRQFRMAPEDREKAELSAAQRTERQMMELRSAIESPETTDQQKQEFVEKLAAAEAVMQKIRAERGEARTEEPRFATPRLSAIRSERVPANMLSDMLAQAGVRVGDPITEDVAKHIASIAKSIDEHWRVGFRGDGRGGIVLTIIAP